MAWRRVAWGVDRGRDVCRPRPVSPPSPQRPPGPRPNLRQEQQKPRPRPVRRPPQRHRRHGRPQWPWPGVPSPPVCRWPCWGGGRLAPPGAWPPLLGCKSGTLKWSSALTCDFGPILQVIGVFCTWHAEIFKVQTWPDKAVRLTPGLPFHVAQDQAGEGGTYIIRSEETRDAQGEGSVRIGPGNGGAHMVRGGGGMVEKMGWQSMHSAYPPRFFGGGIGWRQPEWSDLEGGNRCREMKDSGFQRPRWDSSFFFAFPTPLSLTYPVHGRHPLSTVFSLYPECLLSHVRYQ